jgi:predicted phage-related endonuclease
MAVTGAELWYLAILNLADGTFTWHRIERSEEDIAVLMESEHLLWQRVQAKSPPPMDGSDATTEALGHVYGESDPHQSRNLSHHAGAVAEILALRRDKKAIETREKQLIQMIKLDMAEAEEATLGSLATATWRPQERRSIDIDAMIRAGIDVAPYINISNTRTFKLKERE